MWTSVQLSPQDPLWTSSAVRRLCKSHLLICTWQDTLHKKALRFPPVLHAHACTSTSRCPVRLGHVRSLTYHARPLGSPQLSGRCSHH